MTIHPIPGPDDAIRRVLADTAATDYCDIVAEVRRRFGLHVSETLVAETYRSLRAEPPSGSDDRTPTAPAPDSSTDVTALALRFVEAAGGFARARRAIDDLEHSVRALDEA